MKERGTIKVMKKYMFSLMMVFLMVAGMCIPASATEILPKPLENIPAKMKKQISILGWILQSSYLP